ncbi:retrovirus-related pol polyprotein from transposon TNT 1-94 [Tanacetum coccineum]
MRKFDEFYGRTYILLGITSAGRRKDGFISQDKYFVKILKKIRFTEVKTASTPMETQKPLLKDEDGEEVDVHMHRYQVNPKVSHLYTVKRIFSDYAGASLDRKSTIGGCQFLGCRLISWQCKKQTVVKTINGEAQLHALVDGKKINITESSVRIDLKLEDKEGKGFSGRVTPLFPTMVVQNQSELGEGLTILTDPHHTPTITQSSTQPQKTQKPRKPKRKDTQIPQPSYPSENVADDVVHKELGDSLMRVATTASSLEAEQDSCNITNPRSKATPNESRSLGTTSGGGPRCQETMGDTIAQTRVLDLEKTKTTQQNEIDSLKRRVKKLEKKLSSRTHKLKRLYKVGLIARVESSGDEEDLVDADNEMFDVNVLNGEEVLVAGKNENVVEEVVDATQVSIVATAVTITTEEITLAQARKALKTSKPKVKWIVFQEPSTTTTITTISSQQSQDKGKGIMIEEHVKPMKKKNMEGYKLKDLKSKGFDSIQEMFDRAFKRVNTFEDFKTELVEGKEKRAGEELNTY